MSVQLKPDSSDQNQVDSRCESRGSRGKSVWVIDTLVLEINGIKNHLHREAELTTKLRRGSKKAWVNSSFSLEDSRHLNMQIPSILEVGEEFNCSFGVATVISIDDQSGQVSQA